jgi:ribonuclease-3
MNQGDETSSFYERLEYLGDAVLGFVIAEEVYRRFPHLSEGGLTRIRVSVVAGSTQSQVARDIGLEDALILSDSVTKTGRGMASVLENTVEALTAALYLDAGLDAAREWILRSLGPLISESPAHALENPKSSLQEVLQTRGITPTYRIVGQEGPPHDRCFEAVVEADGDVIGSGSGRTKKEAESAAASAALAGLD